MTKAAWLSAADVNLKVPLPAASPVPKAGIIPVAVPPAVKPGFAEPPLIP